MHACPPKWAVVPLQKIMKIDRYEFWICTTDDIHCPLAKLAWLKRTWGLFNKPVTTCASCKVHNGMSRQVGSLCFATKGTHDLLHDISIVDTHWGDLRAPSLHHKLFIALQAENNHCITSLILYLWWYCHLHLRINTQWIHKLRIHQHNLIK